jgi:hypothetical protein
LQRWLPLASSCLHTSNSLRKQSRPLLCVAGASKCAPETK